MRALTQTSNDQFLRHTFFFKLFPLFLLFIVVCFSTRIHHKVRTHRCCHSNDLLQTVGRGVVKTFVHAYVLDVACSNNVRDLSIVERHSCLGFDAHVDTHLNVDAN